jgi:nitrogen fixation/metabolism regulation signal transduction histidine kinase
VTLTSRFKLYLVFIHLVLAVAIAFAWSVGPWWTIAAELVLIGSLVVGWRLLHRARAGADQSQRALELIRSREFTTRLLPVGEPDVDRLVDAYNRLSEVLRSERVRLQEQQWFLSRIVEASPIGIVTLDLDHQIDTANPAAERLLGLAHAQLLGRRLDQLPDPFGARLGECRPGASLMLDAGDARRIRVQQAEYFDQGFVRRFLVLEELTAELRQSERSAYDRVIRMVAHEVNNSIGVVRSLIEGVRHHLSTDATQTRSQADAALSLALDRARSLSEFVDRFAALVRLPPPHRRPTDLRETLLAATRSIEAGASESVHWSRALGDHPVIAVVDPVQIEQVLLNVLKNAREAVGRGGAIVVRLDSGPTQARIEVDDDGPGFDLDTRAQLFVPFFTTKPQGQGIGLAFVREVLEAHGLRYGLERVDPGLTRFWIELPTS